VVLRITYHLGADNATGRVDLDEVLQVVSQHWEGATVAPCRGVYKGDVEESVMIVIYGSHVSQERTVAFAELLAEHFGQEAVFYLTEELSSPGRQSSR